MAFLTSLFGAISKIFSGIGAKLVTLLIVTAIVIAMAASCYLYIRHKDQIIVSTQTDVTQLQGELSAAIAANGADLQMITALQAQQQQAAEARAAMTGRDQAAESNATSIQNVINRDSVVCPPSGSHTVVSRDSTAGKDSVVAQVLTDALRELAAAQSASGDQK